MKYTLKKYLYLLFLLQILTASSVHAQPESEKSHMFGLRIGKNFSIWRANQAEIPSEYKPKIDYSVGFIFFLRLNNQFLFDIELFFTGKLFQMEYLVYYNSGLNFYKNTSEEIFLIIQIPILLQYNLSGNQRKGIRLLAGPSFGVISCLWSYRGSKRFQKIFGVILGSEYQLSHFLIGLRCDFNLNDTYHSYYNNTVISGKFNTISLTIGWLF